MVSGFYEDKKATAATTTPNNALNMNNGLAFRKKNFRIDWRKIGNTHAHICLCCLQVMIAAEFNHTPKFIAAIDLDRILKELDLYSLQENIDHITFCNIENEIVSCNETQPTDQRFIPI